MKKVCRQSGKVKYATHERALTMGGKLLADLAGIDARDQIVQRVSLPVWESFSFNESEVNLGEYPLITSK